MKTILILPFISLLAIACNKGPSGLPIIGPHDINPVSGDTISLHRILDFSFINQDS